ncbi:oxidoreductase, Zn-dependent and NAD(P)-binding [Escherichia coli]|uniref:Oxidoreductase, Zn-dependent and NAD(P)-binding n=1 Tax=Escherichia coli TaxID=562 RepID=A0A376TJ47_ECOLX|nr:oxidoreductase, Zn-dependent and NAD(P)-binding [Escherichia coli]
MYCGGQAWRALLAYRASTLDLFTVSCLATPFDKGLTFKMGQTHVHAWLGELLPLIEKGLLKPEEIVTHYMPFEEAARGYEIFEKT